MANRMVSAVALTLPVLLLGAAAVAENNCTDGRDNDLDGRADYNDSSCAEKPWFYYAPPYAQAENPCGDGIDNDGDNRRDLYAAGTPAGNLGPEPDCRVERGFASGGYPNLCGNGLDDDGDGLIDLGDSSCHEFYCQDLVDNDGDGSSDGADSDCRCIASVGGTNCTANDVTFNLVGLGTQTDGCTNPQETLGIIFNGKIEVGAQDRYDIGMWVALDGGDAKTGVCGRQILRPAGTVSGDCDSNPFSSSPICTVLDGDGPYFTEATSPDRCGDAHNMPWTLDPPNYDAAFDFVAPPPVDVAFGVAPPAGASPAYPLAYNLLPCNDSDQNGFVEINTATSWDNNEGLLCRNFAQAAPGTSAKCSVRSTPTDVPVGNLSVTCASELAEYNDDGVLDPYESLQGTVTVTNAVANCNPTTGTQTERLRCGTVSYLRIVVDYPELYGSIDTYTENTNPDTDPDLSVVDDTVNGRLIWTIRNRTGTGAGTAGTLGVVWPNWQSRLGFVPTLTYAFKRNTTPYVGPINLPTTIYWSNTLDFDGGGVTETDLRNLSAPASVVQSQPCNTSVQTTPVTLAFFQATRNGNWLTLDWSTATEVANAGFNVYGMVGDEWVQLNEELIPSQIGDSVEPRSYTLELYVPEDVESLVFEDVDVLGRERLHGPFALDEREGKRLVAEPIPWEGIRVEHEALAAERTAALRDSQTAPARGSVVQVGLSAKAAASGGPKAPPLSLGVSRDGVYRVTYEDLLAAGFDLSGVAADRIGLTNRGADVPIYVSAGKTFGPGAYIEFYGRGLDTLYTKVNVYLLATDARQPARAAIDSGAPPAVTPVPSYLETRTFERDLSYAFFSPSGDPWFDSQLQTSVAREWNFNLPVEGLVATSGPASIAVHLFGASEQRKDPDHHVVLRLNGTTLGDYSFDGIVDFPVTVPDSAGALHEGDNTLTIRLPADLGVSLDRVILDGYAVTYPRAFVAIVDALTFAGAGARFEVAGLGSASVVAYRSAAGSLTRLAGTEVSPAGETYTAALAGTFETATYHVASESALLKPAIEAAQPYSDITRGTAQYLIISHPDFIAGLGPLVLAREAAGLTVKVVDVDDVYSQFSGGIFDAEAIRAYIAYAAANMGTEYVLLVGGDTYDYHNFANPGAMSFIPSLYVPTGSVLVVYYTPSDPAYVDLDADGVPDLAIGRLPVRTVAELDTVIAKTLAYEAKDYARTAVFAADSTDPAANVPFKMASDSFITHLPVDWTAQRVYLDDMPLANARAALIAAINGGVALTSYVGHSGPTAWTFKGLFTTKDAGVLTNSGRPTVVTQWGCWNSYYVSPTSEALGNKLLLSGDRGAAAVLGALGLSDDTSENELGEILSRYIAQPGMPIGKAILIAKQELGAEQPDLADVLLGWTLLGDPALVVEP